MSADLQNRHDLPEIRIENCKIKTLSVSSDANHQNDDVISQGINEADDESLRTPKSKKYRIPAITNCPSAPRKPRRSVPYKRWLLEDLQFLDIVNPDEIDSFFRSNTGSLKKNFHLKRIG
ncbi:cyclin-dependent protein kinase inhibitor SMR1-like [Quillaja saponaria]|uniref:Cyclin-dependent protein kinase inhibitor SMR1-like n=1 Tax=Quillaja saponaria TaxID=32244 RepID=A0AAD7VGL8_QUISA|nr:cyclin-dependent protein kinase inhibitor SMR1-like [Quillaja saponaria]